MKKILKLVTSQIFIIVLLMLIQIVALGVTILRLSQYFVYIYLILVAISLSVVLHVINKTDSPSYKLAWVIPILLFPVFGGLFYLVFYRQKRIGRVYKKTMLLDAHKSNFLGQSPEIKQAFLKEHPYFERQTDYMNDYANANVYINTDVVYYPLGEDKKAAMLAEMDKAEKYIFLEYFIIKPGVFWNDVLEMMKKKAAQGVEVRLMYDAMGCHRLPRALPKQLAAFGIKTKIYNPFTPFLTVVQNNRSHRKICVVDGHTAFCGGINLADEYINIASPYGHWKDTAVKITGPAAFEFSIMFLQSWDLMEAGIHNYGQFQPEKMPAVTAEGYVMPYGDTPHDKEAVSEFMYMEPINGARKYLHIMSPYIILDHGMLTGLKNAAKSGVDVKIIVPHVADHWYAHAVAKAYYRELTLSNVKLFEYMPGFIHAKSFVWDDIAAIVGSVNLDYRSLYLHSECAVWFAAHPAVADVEEDFQKCLALSQEITLEASYVKNPLKRLLYSVLRIFAPMM